MNNLYNSLLSPIIEFDAEGRQITHAPTAVMLRAARVLKQLDDTNTTNLNLIQQLQLRVHSLEAEVEHLQKEQQNAKTTNTSSGSEPESANTGETSTQ